jgi:hypothetical protein
MMRPIMSKITGVLQLYYGFVTKIIYLVYGDYV